MRSSILVQKLVKKLSTAGVIDGETKGTVPV